MKKLVGLCWLCLFGVVPGASAQFDGGDGDGYDSARLLATSFPAFVTQYTAGGSGDGHDSATLATSFPAFVTQYTTGGAGDGYDSAWLLAMSFPAFVTQYTAGGAGDGYDSARLATSFPAFINMLYTGGAGDGYDSAASEPSAGTTRYVATDGSNAFNNCTNPANSCATITHAVNKANPGDTLDLAAGTYAAPVVMDKALSIVGTGVIVQ